MKALLLSLLIGTTFCAKKIEENKSNQNDLCEWCGATEAPENATWQTTIASPEEEGTRLKVSGNVYTAEGKLASEVILYLYHTNAKGLYPKRGNEKGNGRRHGYLRGWIKTDKSGKYSFDTIKPAAYPGRTEPAHIHLTVKEPGKDEYWLESYLFADDELLSAQDKLQAQETNRFRHILELENKNGVLYGERDIQLKE